MRKWYKKTKGFTLVELIVVLVILAILAALLVPALTGYIDKAKEKEVLSQTRGILTAAQASISEQYAEANFDVPTDSTTIANTTFNIEAGTKVGVISNYSLYDAQHKSDSYYKNSNRMASYNIATNVLNYLDDQYSFNKQVNPKGQNSVTYEKNYGQPGVLIAYTSNGQILFVEFGTNGYLAHINAATGESTIVKNASFANLR